MRILLSNDDGVHAPGLQRLAKGLRAIAEVRVVAPDRDRSGASNSLTLENPLRVLKLENGDIRVNGTPTDCVHLALTGLFEREPDVVIAGINHGANLGDDVLYSGTVAAAMEGRHLGLPAMAVSLAAVPQDPFPSSDPDQPPPTRVHRPARHFESAVRVVAELLGSLVHLQLPATTILNINVPDLPYDEIRGLRATRLGNRHRAEPVIRGEDPRGRPVYWVGQAGREQDAGPGTDFHAIRERFVSVTPIQVDLTCHSALERVGAWLPGAER